MNANHRRPYAEHHFRRVLPGDIEAMRTRLSEALEEFDYIVLSENPLQARREPRRNVITANVLEYDTRLTVALRSSGPASTIATFEYGVSYLYSRAERL